MKKSMILVLLLLLAAVGRSQAFSAQDSLYPTTAKGAWRFAYEQLNMDFGFSGPPILFKAYPEKKIDKNDTRLCSIFKDRYGMDSVLWNGKAYTWIFECRIPALHTDSMFKMSVYLKIATPAFVTKETIYKPITKYADTVGIAEDTWLNSDSLFIKLNLYGEFLPTVFLERSIRAMYPSGKTTWNLQKSYSGDPDIWDVWMIIDAQTGVMIDIYVVSVSEPLPSEVFSLSPNPVSTAVSLSGLDGVASVRVVNSLGIEVLHCPVSESKAIIDVSALTSGVYFVQFPTRAGMASKPIIVTH
jgi:hypothetical protein